MSNAVRTWRLPAAIIIAGVIVAWALTGQHLPSTNLLRAPAAREAVQPVSSPAMPLAEKHVRMDEGWPSPTDRMVICNAQLTLRVKTAPDVQAELSRMARTWGGFVTSSELSTQDGIRRSSVTIRLPARRFQDALSAISMLGKVESRSESGEDVTQEYVDLNSRLRNLGREEQAYLAVLGRARRVPDILAVERELSRVRGEIEQAAGRRKFLANQVAYATVSVDLIEPAPVITTGVDWRLAPTAQKAVHALSWVVRKGVSVCIWLVVFAPVWGVALLAALWGRRIIQRHMPHAAA